ncbi:hypothetical protein [Sphingomonas sp.]|uniref:hypothetical protein n=1 Tax=Sphingomonas sp. TaxID=28214 RepID=UPI001EB689D1|nr:hypothetical protein [Sphingomonas sp.]MBX3595181.1 hypothetical protein [Sphingomonas sp.]
MLSTATRPELLIPALALVALFVVSWIWRRLAERARRERRQVRRRRSIAYAKAWDFVMRRKAHLRLEHHRDE